MKKEEVDERPDFDLDMIEEKSIDNIISRVQTLFQCEARGITVDLLAQYLDSLIEFNKSFNAGSTEPDHFLSLSDIEDLVIDLENKQKKLNKELAWEKAKNINEKILLAQKKRIS
jgi:hypothetical protein